MHTLPFVGRDTELGLLQTAIRELTSGQGRLVFLSGDGGVGKTRLMQEVQQHASQQGICCAMGRAYPLETAIPYAPFADALTPVLAALDAAVVTRLTRGSHAVLSALAPALLTRGDSSGNLALDYTPAAEQRVRLHASVLACLKALGDRQPLLLTLENLQWADHATLELLHYLGRQIHTLPVMLVASWNETDVPLPDGLRTALRSLRSQQSVLELTLPPLAATAVRDMVARHFAVSSATCAPLVERIHAVAGGNPFFVEQMLEELTRRHALRQQSGEWVGWHAAHVELPPSLHEVMEARLARLDGEARQLAELLSVAGSSATHDLVLACTREVLGWEEAQSESTLDRLRHERLVLDRVQGRDVSYEFAHPLLQLALRQRIGLVQARRWHALIARTLESLPTPDAEAVAAHWLHADPDRDSARAIPWLIDAGLRAIARRARQEGAVFLQAALDRADRDPHAATPETLAALVDDLARVYRRLADYQRAVQLNMRARDLAAARGDTRGRAMAERRIGLSLQGLARREEALGHFDIACALAADTGDRVLHGRALLARSDCRQALGLVEAAKSDARDALAAAEASGDMLLLTRAHRMQLMLHIWTGPAHRAWTHARAAVQHAEATGEPNLQWSAHWAAAVLAGLTSNTTALGQHLAAAEQLARQLASPLLELRTLEVMLEYRAGTGEWQRALADGDRGLALARVLEQSTIVARMAHWVSGMLLQRGQLDDAARLVDEAWEVSGAALADADRPFEVHGILPAFVARTRLLHARGAHREALALGERALMLADRTGYIAWAVHRLLPTMAMVALELRDYATLRRLRDRLATDASRLSHAVGTAWVRVIDGELAMQDGRSTEAIAAMHHAIDQLEAVPYPFDAASARLRLAAMHRVRGANAEAVLEARAALTVFESLEAAPAATAARQLLEELGVRTAVHVESTRVAGYLTALPTPPPTGAGRADSPFAALTARELDIVRLVARRLSNKEIGAALGITARTAGTHLANVFGKVGVRDRTGLGDLAREHGLHDLLTPSDR